MKAKTITVSSCFPAASHEVWEKLQKISTLQYIATPYATFKPIGDVPPVWTEGGTLRLDMKLFGFISVGVHTIYVKRIDEGSLSMYTNENNKYIPVWNHRIILRPTDNGKSTDYRDEVEIFAGWRTPMVAVWCRYFYRHRQKKWLTLLSGL